MKTRQIAAWVAAGLMLSTTVLTSCKKDGDNNTLPPIGGFNSSDEVGASSLIAYWPFDGNYTETKQNLTGTNNGATFTTGVKGQAYKGSGGSYVAFSNPGTAFNSLGSYTLSVWINEPAQPVNNTTSSYIAGQGAQGVFFMYDKVSDWNLMALNLEPHRSDTLRVKAGFNNTGAPVYKGIIPEVLLGGSLNQWIHLAMTYDGASSTYTFYRNGIAVNASSAWGTATSTKVWTDGNKTSPMGNITYKNAPGGFVIGAFPQAVSPKVYSAIDSPQPWSGNFQGSIDELRIYNKALQTSDIGALYQLGQAGR